MDWQLTVFWMRNQCNTLKLNKKDIKEGDGLLSQARASTKALVLSFACLQTCWVKIAGTEQLHIDCSGQSNSQMSMNSNPLQEFIRRILPVDSSADYFPGT